MIPYKGANMTSHHSPLIERLAAVQAALQAEHLDGWLLYDFHGINVIAHRVLGIPPDRVLTRRWACFIPARGRPRWLVHAIEQNTFAGIAEAASTYISWREWNEGLRHLLGSARRVAMEISPGATIPTISRVDAGTVDLVRSLGVDVVSSADLVQVAEAVWTERQLASHRRAARVLITIKDLAFALVRERLANAQPITEVDVQQFILDMFRQEGLETDHAPIVATNAHAASPHYVPSPESNAPIQPGDFLLIDLWAREKAEDAVYADITWVAYVGEAVPPRVQEVFDVVRRARDAAVSFIQNRLVAGEPVYGYEVDDVARAVIRDAGLGNAFIHRTGHSLGVDVHGNGVNLDNLETQDRRRLIPGVGFTIEPGVYLPREGFGIRLEIDCYVHEDRLEITTLPLQDAVITLEAPPRKGGPSKS